MDLPCQCFVGFCQITLKRNLSIYTSINSLSPLGMVKILNFCQATGLSSCFLEVETEAQREQERKELGGGPFHPDYKDPVFI